MFENIPEHRNIEFSDPQDLVFSVHASLTFSSS